MKKLSLEMLRLTSDEVLGRSQMKKITEESGGTAFGQPSYPEPVASDLWYLSLWLVLKRS